jgi:hypothetical protein
MLVFISGTPEDQLISEPYRRKKSDADKAKASKRGVVENALEFFSLWKNNGSNSPGDMN